MPHQIIIKQNIEAGEGIEPSHGGFADPSVSSSPSGH